MHCILGIDTAGARGSIALVEEGRAVAEAPLPEGGHSSGLAAAIERMLAARGLRVKDLAGIAVAEGPGSFTGLRIGLAWAKGAALGGAIPLALVSSHDAAAHALRDQAPRFATVTQGERGHVMAALWAGGGHARLLWGPEVLPEDEAMERLRAEAGAAIPVAAASLALEEWVQDWGGTNLAARPLAPAVAVLGALALAAG
ncbi:MAG: tRNA (adenosine(37)-N6)-threonylcarbamoyltransferase complex dimerization subunit type 1 TsaB, partial [Bacteroidota bacterium]